MDICQSKNVGTMTTVPSLTIWMGDHLDVRKASKGKSDVKNPK